MTETNQKRFTGEGPTASEDHRRFKKWVQSHIFYKKVESEAQGPFLYTLLDGEALAAVDELDFSTPLGLKQVVLKSNEARPWKLDGGSAT